MDGSDPSTEVACITPQPARSRLHRAMDLITEEVAEIFKTDAGRYEPRLFKKISQLMKICKALRTEAAVSDYKLTAEERDVAMGRPVGGFVCGAGDMGEDLEGFRDPMDDEGGLGPNRFPMRVMNPMNPMPRGDGNFNTEIMLAAAEAIGMLGRKSDAEARAARNDEAMQIGKLLESSFVSDERKIELRRRLEEILTAITAGDTHDQPTRPDLPEHQDLVPAHGVR